ncbi:CIA30 family protein [Aerosakkonemataceae cyanobacterium BLCC-F154]|uniref:CIA30 family protein n=1 Tax=Floridaenema fluviatile BLCC-F154 TaxID=3153640 RepID=A0ABV4YFM5_9CYAN
MAENNRAPWEFGRFFQTLTYFEVIPFVNCIQRIFTGNFTEKSTEFEGGKRVGVVLVVGATGGVGKRVVKRLVDRGYQVRALVRNLEKAQEMFGNNLELVAGDITKPETLTEQVFRNITAVICCTGARVQPVEGDTPNREKYYQGVKFYLPEVVDSPELVEYQGVKNLVQAAAKYLGKADEKMIFDFGNAGEEIKNVWGAIDDVVMGGVSASNIQLVDNTALFAGNVSTANSGGFASIRTRNFDTALDLSAYEGVELRVKGDGNRYKFFLRTDTKWDGIGYSYSFDTIPNTWLDIRIPFVDLVPVFRAKTVPDSEKIDASNIRSCQLMLSKFEYDGALNPNFTPGGFALQIETIKAYNGASLPQFILVSSAGVTRPGRPGINLEEEPPAVRMNDALGGILTWKLRGEDSVRESGIAYTIIRPTALTEEAGGKSLVFEQGDNIRGKVSREDIAELCVQTLEEPKACNLTFEVKETETSANRVNWQTLFSSVQPN